MPKQWAKIFRDCSDSDRLTDLLAKNGFAEALYWRLKAKADDFGRYLGDPCRIAEGLCPRNLIRGHFKLKKVEQALADMEACGVVRFYDVDGQRYVEIVDYFSHAHEVWTSVGKPEYPAPLDWQVPEELVKWLLEHSKNPNAKNAFPERFGVTKANWPVGTPYPWNTVGVPTPIPTPEGMAGVGGKGGGTDVDVDSDVDSDTSDSEGDVDAPAGANDLPAAPDLCDESFDPVIQAGMAYFASTNPPILEFHKAQKYSRECRAQLQGNSDFTDDQIAEAFRSNGPRSGNERTFCGNWFERLRRECVDVGSDDPVVAAFIRKTGQKRPDDPFGIAKWDDDLTAFRAAQEVPA